MSKHRHPVSDPEILELFADEPELLAVTDAIHATYRPPRRLPRPVLLMAAVVAVAIVAAVAWPRDGALIESALAVVGEEPVIHSVVRRDAPRTTIIDLRSGRGLPGVVEVETWYDTRNARLRTVTRRNGVVVSDAVSQRAGATPGAPRGEQAQLLTQSYRAALADGRARKGTRIQLGARAAVWLELTGRIRYRVAVDAESYEPVAFEPIGGAPRWSVVELASVPATSGLFTPLPPRAHPMAGNVTRSQRVDLARAAKFGWALWGGQQVGPFSLRSVHLQQLSRRSSDGSRQSARGLELIYSGPGRIIIRHAPTAEPAYGFVEGRLTFDFDAIPPMGRVAVTTPRAGEEWFGQLRFREAFVTIAAPTRASLLATAQTLRPL